MTVFEIFLLISILLTIFLLIAILIVILKRNKDPIAKYLQSDLQGLRKEVDSKLTKSNEDINKFLKEQIDSSKDQIEKITKELLEVKHTGKEILSFTNQLGQLEKILSNPKQRGVLGEYFLEAVLKNILPPNSYKIQFAFKDGEIADAVIFLDGDRLVAIDSKFTLENYDKLLNKQLSASEVEDAEKKLIRDLKGRIEETSKYIKPEDNTVDFAFMFIPSETLFYDLLSNKIDRENVLEYAFKEKHVIIVSPTTFYAYLQTVLQGLRTLEVEKKTKLILKKLNGLHKHMTKCAKSVEKVGKSLGATVNHYNTAQKQFQYVNKDIKQITENDKFEYTPELLDSESPKDRK